MVNKREKIVKGMTEINGNTYLIEINKKLLLGYLRQ